jgi:hypothetical protein
MSVAKLWGWVPTLSGDLTLDYIKEQLADNDSDEYDYSLDTDKRIVTVKTSYGTMEIHIEDDRGLCSLNIEESKFTDEFDTEVWVDSVWMEFRRMLDSCSGDLCDCSAMDQVIYADERVAVKELTQRFVDTMEWASDSMTYVELDEMMTHLYWDGPDAWARRMRETVRMFSLAEINHLYGTRFLEIMPITSITGRRCAKENDGCPVSKSRDDL